MSIATLGGNPSFDRSPWGEVARLCRRICVLRASGRSIEAAHVQSAELSPALDAARRADEPAAEVEARLSAIFAAEQERVATAGTLAELLAPLLLERLPFDPPSSVVHSALPPPAMTRAPRVAAPSIADFIDEMLGQERAPSPPSPLRRAS